MARVLLCLRSKRIAAQIALLLSIQPFAGNGLAQEVASSRPPVWRAGASAMLIATDNVGLTDANKQSAIGAEAGIDVHLIMPYRRLKGFADYSLFGSATRSEQTAFQHRNELTAGFNAEVIETYAFVDVEASYGTHPESVFGPQTRSLAVENNNQIEGGTIRVSPSLRGRFGDSGRVEARASESVTKNRGTEVGDAILQTASLSLDSGVQPLATVWKVFAFGGRYDFDAGRRTTEASLRGDIGWAFSAESVASIIFGREGNDFQTSGRVYESTHGLSVDWRPNERTRFYAEGLRRYFGTGYLVTLNYRLPRWVFNASSSRSSSTPGQDRGPSGLSRGSAFDVLFLQLESVEPDPDRRRMLVQDLLARNGIDGTQQLLPSLATSGVLLAQTHELSASWTGVRDTAALGISRVVSQRLDTLVSLPVTDAFQGADRIEQSGIQASWLHRLTPLDDLSVLATWSRAKGSFPTVTSTTGSAQVRWSRKVSFRSTLGFSLRQEVFSSPTSDSYHANFLSCDWRTQF